MIQPLFRLLRTTPQPRRLALFGLSAVVALVVGFKVVTPRMAEKLISAGGYYYVLGLFGLFVYYAWRVAEPRREVWRGWLRRPGWVGAGLALATLFALWSDPIKHKILFDEYVLQATALHMHATKEVGAVYRAYDIAGSWVPIDTFLDKRPYFFVFLVSLVHDFTGFRIANMFIVNAALTPVLMGLVYWLGYALTGRRGAALLAVGLLATMPLLGQNATGAGMELHNLTMLALTTALAVLYLRAPDDDRLALLVLSALLLAQSRYESVLFVAPTALVIVVGWLKARRLILPWVAVGAPVLLMPYVWHNRFLAASPLLWQLHDGQTSRFSFSYLPDNLRGAWGFFCNIGTGIANSWYLTLLGAGGGIWFLWTAWRWARETERRELPPQAVAVLAFGGAIAANLTLLMFYYWSRLDDVIASRFALPMCLLLALLAALLVRGLDERQLPATRVAAAGLGVWLLIWCFPAMAHRTYTNQNLVMQEVEWEHDELVKLRGPILFVSNKSTLPFVLWHVPTIINGVGRQRGEQIAFHLHEGTFKEVVIAQALRPTTLNGDMGVDPDDLMPDSYHLETIAEKRFGGRWARLSRLVSIDPAPGAATPAAAGGAPGTETAAP